MAAYVRPIKFEPGTFLRSCDTCGVRFRANELVRGSDGHFRCRRWCSEETQLDRDRIAAASDRRREAPPPPYGTPYVFGDAYEQEGVLFNFLANMPVVDSAWPGGQRLGAAPATIFRSLGHTQVNQGIAGSYSPVAAGETMRYLYQLIVENKRPTSWITRARAKLRELAEWVYSTQFGFGLVPSQTLSNSIFYGACNTTIKTAEQGCMGLGMLYAYLALGDAKYLASARGFADALTNRQQGGLLVTEFSSSDAAGTIPVNYGTWTRSNGGPVFDHVYQADSLICLEFLQQLYNVTGDELHGSDTTISGTFTMPPQQLLSVSMANARAFWQVGAYDASLGQTITGLSASTPREYFNSYPANKGVFLTGTGSWEFQDGGASTGTLITGSYIALALRSLYGYEGLSATVTGIWSWLMGFSSNPAYQPTTTSLGPDTPTLLGASGTYNPKLSLTTLLQVRTAGGAASAMNGDSFYDWRCAGYMAPIQRSQDPASLDLAKDFLTKGVTTYPEDFSQGTNGSDYTMMQGVSGLSGQVANAP